MGKLEGRKGDERVGKRERGGKNEEEGEHVSKRRLGTGQDVRRRELVLGRRELDTSFSENNQTELETPENSFNSTQGWRDTEESGEVRSLQKVRGGKLASGSAGEKKDKQPVCSAGSQKANQPVGSARVHKDKQAMTPTVASKVKHPEHFASLKTNKQPGNSAGNPLDIPVYKDWDAIEDMLVENEIKEENQLKKEAKGRRQGTSTATMALANPPAGLQQTQEMQRARAKKYQLNRLEGSGLDTVAPQEVLSSQLYHSASSTPHIWSSPLSTPANSQPQYVASYTKPPLAHISITSSTSTTAQSDKTPPKESSPLYNAIILIPPTILSLIYVPHPRLPRTLLITDHRPLRILPTSDLTSYLEAQPHKPNLRQPLILLIDSRTPRKSKNLIREIIDMGYGKEGMKQVMIDAYDWRVVRHADWRGEKREDREVGVVGCRGVDWDLFHMVKM